MTSSEVSPNSHKSSIFLVISDNIAPPPKLTVSEWADRYRVLSSESSAASGKWYTSRAEYQRGMMDAITDPKIEQVVIMSSSQIGKSEILNNIIGYYIHQDPSPILFLQPTAEMAEAYSKDRIAPMVRDTPVLTERVSNPKSKTSGNTILHKVFTGGHLTLAGSNSPAALASRPIRIVLADEVDRYPASAGGEGDPVNLAIKRTTTFWNKKKVLVSTPTIAGASRIEQAYAASDMRKYHVPCKDCGRKQVLDWKQVSWDEGKPETARYVCIECGSIWSDGDRYHAIKNGEWIAEKETCGIAGFWLWEGYSTWVKLSQTVEAFLLAKKQTQQLKVFINTSLGEVWDEDETREKVDYDKLIEEAEIYDRNSMPDDVLMLTCGVDVQGDRLELEIVGWGVEEESWSIEYKVLMGNPSHSQVWDDLTAYLDSDFMCADGTNLKISATAIDSGGLNTDDVYRYVYRQGRFLRIFAVKGMSQQGRSIVPQKPTKVGRPKINLFVLGVDTAKQTIYSRLSLIEEGAGFCHFPKSYDEAYFKMLTAERLTKKYVSGKIKYVWEKRAGQRNEALDCRVYAFSALKILNPNFQLLTRQRKASKISTLKVTGEIKPEIIKSAESWVDARQTNNWFNKY